MMRILYVWIASVMLCVSCSWHRHVLSENVGAEDRYLDSLAVEFSRYAIAGQNDSVILNAGSVMRRAMAEKDTVSALYACVFAAQSWLNAEDIDSVKYYLDVAGRYIEYCSSPFINVLYNNVYGSYSIRAGLDYTMALDYYLDGLRWAETASDVDNQACVMLNIANIFYLQHSPDGLHYAEEGLRLIRMSESAGSYVKSAAYINTAQMLFLNDSLRVAEASLDTAWTMVKNEHIYSLYSPVLVLYAQLSEKKGMQEEARDFYMEAVRFSRYSDHGTMSQVQMLYGDFLVDKGDYEDALACYRRGLDISVGSGSMEFYSQLLNRLADCSWMTGDKEVSLDYYRRYSDYHKSLSADKQDAFNRAVLSLKEVEHESEILQREMERQRLQHSMIVLSVVTAWTLIVIVLVFLLYYRKKTAYRRLVEQHRHYAEKLEQEKRLNSMASSPSRELFCRIEDLMVKEKYFTQKGITLETVAEKVKTNRTYCSKAINTFAGCPFYKWLDSLRIEEATKRIVADSSVLFKQLAEDLGYSSVSAFSKAFFNEIGCTPSIYRDACRKKPKKETDEKIAFS